jgi:hypothetical protein
VPPRQSATLVLRTAQCTTSKEGRTVVYRHIGEEYLERVHSYQETPAYQKALRKRQVWVEPLFAEAKDWHGMRRFRLRRHGPGQLRGAGHCFRTEPQAAPQEAGLLTAPAAQRGGHPLGCSLA